MQSWRSGSCRFLSTPSARRATCVQLLNQRIEVISIHALREEGDSRAARLRARNPISIHALREEGDPSSVRVLIASARFLSTPSARRATAATTPSSTSPGNFYPRPPRGGRPQSATKTTTPSRFLSTPSARRATELYRIPAPRTGYFYPRPPRGGRLPRL